MYRVRLDPQTNVIAIGTGPVADGFVAISDAHAATIRAGGGLWLKGTNAPRWRFDAAQDVLTANTDTRLAGTWSKTQINGAVGSQQSVQLTLSSPINGARVLWFGENHRRPGTRVVFADGVATIGINTDRPCYHRLAYCSDFQLTNALEVSIVDADIWPAS